MATSPRSSGDHVRRRLTVYALLGLLAACAGPKPKPEPNPPVETSPMTTHPVDTTFRRLVRGQLTSPTNEPGEGWEATLPSGQKVVRSTLQSEARPLIAIGPEAVPDLLPWVHHENAAIRYVAMFALEQITGEHVQISYFNEDRAQQDAAITAWRHWYDRYTTTHPHS